MPRVSLQTPHGNPSSIKNLRIGAAIVVTTPVAITSPQEDLDHAMQLTRLAVAAQVVTVATLFVSSDSMKLLAMGVIAAVWYLQPSSCGVPYRFILLVAIAFSILFKNIATTFETDVFLGIAALLGFAVLFRNHYLGLSQATGPQKFNPELRKKPGSAIAGMWDAWILWNTYARDGTPMPGHYRSPAGSYHFRIALTIGVMVFLTFPFYAFARDISSSTDNLQTTTPEAHAALMSFTLSFLLPLPLMLIAAFIVSLNILGRSHAARQAALQDNALAGGFYNMLEAVKSSKDPDERESIPVGKVVHDNGPISLPFKEGSHYAIFGANGAGKTAFILRLAESLFHRGDVSIFALDLKSDTNELYYTLEAAANQARSDATPIPFWRFTNRTGDSSHLFSMFHQLFWRRLTPEQRADVTLNIMGLGMTRAHGESWFVDAAGHILRHVYRKYPEIMSFVDLLARVEYEVDNPRQSRLPKSVILDGAHAQLIIARLSAVRQLNDVGQHPAAVVQNAWDCERFYREPCIGFSALAAMEGPITAPEMARIQIAAMIRCGLLLPPSERRMRVVILIDELARIVSGGLEMLFQQARSTNTSLICTAQSVANLQQGTLDLTSTIESETAAQFWFKSVDRKAIEQIERLGGLTTEKFANRSQSISNTPNGTSYTRSSGYSEQLVPRLTANEIQRAAATKHHYICRITDNQGHTQFDGLPVIGTTGGYHLTESEYRDRKKPWPEKTPDTIIAGQDPPDDSDGVPVLAPSSPPRPDIDVGTIGATSLRERK